MLATLASCLCGRCSAHKLHDGRVATKLTPQELERYETAMEILQAEEDARMTVAGVSDPDGFP